MPATATASVVHHPRCCSTERHEALKRYAVLWRGATQFLGLMQGADGSLIEIRACTCTGTLGRPIAQEFDS